MNRNPCDTIPGNDRLCWSAASGATTPGFRCGSHSPTGDIYKYMISTNIDPPSTGIHTYSTSLLRLLKVYVLLIATVLTMAFVLLPSMVTLVLVSLVLVVVSLVTLAPTALAPIRLWHPTLPTSILLSLSLSLIPNSQLEFRPTLNKRNTLFLVLTTL